ncbi:TNF receptor-associated factor 2-like [Lytechinus variegatus]|uniref:TNF receptor-associated factor 2-like n=1 Tax=Lytechinus variegatus TaxID=7654 RepID=UPI001BB21C33|nr:TNF receptor-associated factor 2-like [Lytechinus variegatus]
MGGKKKICRSGDSVGHCRCGQNFTPISEETECPSCTEERNRSPWRTISNLLPEGESSCLLDPGILIWFILARFITGDITSTVSGSFRTSQYGYKLCVELDVFTNPIGDRRILLRPIVLKGPDDAVNQWPFRESITFKIINRSNPRKNKVLTFRTDQGGISRPQNGMRVAASAGVECPDIGQLFRDGFIENGTLVVVCECHSSDIPRQTRETLPTSCEVSTHCE